jgi:hypothetical protein
VEGFLLGEDGFVVVAAVFDEVMDDASQFMSRGRDGFGGSKWGFHSSKKSPKALWLRCKLWAATRRARRRRF